MQAQYVSVAVRLGRERQWTVFTLIRLFTGVCADMTFQRRRPRERQVTERTQHSVGRGRVRAYFLSFFPVLVFVIIEVYVDVAVIADIDTVGN